MAPSPYHHWVFLKCIDVLKAQLMNINSHYKKSEFPEKHENLQGVEILGPFRFISGYNACLQNQDEVYMGST